VVIYPKVGPESPNSKYTNGLSKKLIGELSKFKKKLSRPVCSEFLEVKGSSKLSSEMKQILGKEKVTLVKDPFMTELGEGEPRDAEEIICADYGN